MNRVPSTATLEENHLAADAGMGTHWSPNRDVPTDNAALLEVERTALGLLQGCDAAREGESVWDDALAFLNAIRSLKPAQNVDLTTTDDVFTPMVRSLVARRARWEICADLVAVTFAYCAVHPDLAGLVCNFARAVEQNRSLRSQLREICGTAPLSPNYKPGVYTVVATLETFDKLDIATFETLRLGLGPVLRLQWAPLWAFQYPDLRLDAAFLAKNLMRATTQEHRLDFLIASLSPDLPQWEELQSHSSKSVDFFLYSVARRSLHGGRYLPPFFKTFCQDVLSTCTKNDCFKRLENDTQFNLSVLMEIVDHPDLNFLEEPHLVSLLHCALRRVLEICTQEQIQTLHLELGSMGTTLSLPGLLNIVQYLLTRFLLSMGTLVNNARHLKADNKKWATRESPYQLPPFFDKIVPKISPVSRSASSFDHSGHESHFQTTKLSTIVWTVLQSINYLENINCLLLDFYERNGTGLSAKPKDGGANDFSHVVENKARSDVLDLFFIAGVSVMLLAEQLQEDGYLSKVIGTHESRILGKQLSLSTRTFFKAIIRTFGKESAHELIKFLARTSRMELTLQRVSMRILQCVLVDERGSALKIGAPAHQALHDYLGIWNDGSEVYSQLYSALMMPMPAVATAVINFPQLLASASPSWSRAMGRVALGSASNTDNISCDTKRTGPASRYNTHATSFIPSTKSQHQKTNGFESEDVLPLAMASQPTSATADYGFVGNQPERYGTAQTSPFSATRHSQFPDGSKSAISMSGPIANSSTNATKWDAGCFSQGPLLSTDFSSAAVNTGKNYIMGGHSRATNNSRAQSVHVDRFDYLQQ
ncbi:LADA_0H11496g1_1 [Lachancea dasiensis]|uniref:LADA_0H11496g1_1 n=1 Tax=Lachancea dasiensis TaxID=1072105 RepID=A0A1G4K3F7_9SACH|nr:LADA_0H11496g1_1 [Lachancea dasiensis]